MNRPPGLAVVCDLVEENWPSMDLAAEMLIKNLHKVDPEGVRATRVCPAMCRRFSRLPCVGHRPAAFNGDRFVNRFWDYPRYLRHRLSNFDLFHLCDHSYAQLVHVLPEARTGVFCHDLGTFRCLLEPGREPRPRWFKAMARRVLGGLQKAAVVFYGSDAVRLQIERHGLLDPSRLVKAPYGVAPEFTPKPSGPEAVADLLPGAAFLLHVGSCVPRKRIDVLLDVFARLRGRHRDLLLVQAGGTWTADQRRQIHRLGIASAVAQFSGLSRSALATFYRRARLVLLPSEAEGFGLPLIEALACGSVVVVSDLPVLREVGGTAAVYCPIGQVARWVKTVYGLLTHPSSAPAPRMRLAHARRYSWAAQAQTVIEAYQRLLTNHNAPTTKGPVVIQ